MRTLPIVAIDGPAGAGKSTVARELAKALGFVLVDTGAMYRALALAASRANIDFNDAAKVSALGTAMLERGAIVFEQTLAGVAVRLSGEDVSLAIRTPEIALGASTVSKYPEVRQVLLNLQRRAAANGGVVLEGRDIGTVVCPDAEVKFFLTAKPEVRAKRRHEELLAKGQTVTFEDTLRDVRARDEQDENRPVAPLKPAADSRIIDSSSWTLDETIARMLQIAKAGATR